MSREKVYLADYKAPVFTITHTDLTVDIYEQEVIVTNQMKIKRLDRTGKILKLNGEKLILKSVKLLGHEIKNYQLDDKYLTLEIDNDEFELTVQNVINPYENKALEGFYQSGPMLCTQNEPEGFRKITYFLDRSDNLSVFKTKLIADQKKFPILLGNGDCIEAGTLEGGRHFKVYSDPFLKPSYLFAMVAGDLGVVTDHFVTKSGRNVKLEIYVDKGNEFKSTHAMESLKKSMKWDEDVFGLEYDLNTYMIVATDAFNFGAMENKGLNIFNSLYVLASVETATDVNFQNIEGVIGHEYFHNWTGNRVTVRDWFQLTLKEGLTVYRDQEFSSDMQSRKVKRIQDVMMLKERQFVEDAGPMSHPIKPKSYLEINNFYTATVYEKGAEVIRMMETLLGREKFNEAVRDYIKTNDGKAATTEDFVHSMAKVSGRDMTQFSYWYDQSGTPRLKLDLKKNGSEWILKYEQSCKLNNQKAQALLIPFRMALLDIHGQYAMIEQVLELKEPKGEIKFQVSHDKVIPSFNRNFSAPIYVEYEYSDEDLIHLLTFDTDAYARFEVGQILMKKAVMDLYNGAQTLSEKLIFGFKNTIKTNLDDPYYLSFMLTPPSDAELNLSLPKDDYEGIEKARKKFMSILGMALEKEMNDVLTPLEKKAFSLAPKSMGERSLKRIILNYLFEVKPDFYEKKAIEIYHHSQNMTDSLGVLNLLRQRETQNAKEVLKDFYQKWQSDKLVMLKWFSVNAAYVKHPKELLDLTSDKAYDAFNPNMVRSVFQSFMSENLVQFNRADGAGYELVASEIQKIDKFNPQLAARLSGKLNHMSRLDDVRKAKLKEALEKLSQADLSNDTFEIVKANLNG